MKVTAKRHLWDHGKEENCMEHRSASIITKAWFLLQFQKWVVCQCALWYASKLIFSTQMTPDCLKILSEPSRSVWHAMNPQDCCYRTVCRGLTRDFTHISSNSITQYCKHSKQDTIFKGGQGIEAEKRGRVEGRERREDEHGGCFQAHRSDFLPQ